MEETKAAAREAVVVKQVREEALAMVAAQAAAEVPVETGAEVVVVEAAATAAEANQEAEETRVAVATTGTAEATKAEARPGRVETVETVEAAATVATTTRTAHLPSTANVLARRGMAVEAVPVGRPASSKTTTTHSVCEEMKRSKPKKTKIQTQTTQKTKTNKIQHILTARHFLSGVLYTLTAPTATCIHLFVGKLFILVIYFFLYIVIS